MNVSGEKISSGFLSDYEPLGVNGDPVYRAATQIRTLLMKELGGNIANLFATPLRDDRNNSIDWYSAEKGTPRPFNSLTISEQENYSNWIKEKLASVEDLGRRLSSTPQNQTAQTYADLLKSIQNYPDASQIFIVNDHPVIAFWGFQNRQKPDIPKAATIAGTALSALNATPEVATPASYEGSLINRSNLNPYPNSDVSISNTQEPISSNSISHTRSSWGQYGWWILILLLLMVGTPTFMRGCSTDFPLFNDGAKTSPSPLTVVDSNSNNGSGRSNSTATTGSTEPKLTKEALIEKDLSIFNGNWNLITELVNSRTNEIIKLHLTFNEIGQGTATVIEKNGRTCSGSATARIDSDNSFSISSSDLICGDKGSYIPTSAQCKVRTDSSKADCMLKCAAGQCDAVFQRQ
jgi:hypothetical protein